MADLNLEAVSNALMPAIGVRVRVVEQDVAALFALIGPNAGVNFFV